MPKPPVHVLEYQNPAHHPRPSPVIATLLCLPGLVCWVLVATALLHLLTGYDVRLWTWTIPPTYILLLWAVAIVTALVSVAMYGLRIGRDTPWYVTMCLLINTLGLVFTGVVLGLAFVGHILRWF
jgi:hypothetical protein